MEVVTISKDEISRDDSCVACMSFYFFGQYMIHFDQKLIMAVYMVIGRAVYNVEVYYFIFDGYINR